MRHALLAVALAMLCAPARTAAQPPAKQVRVGFLSAGSPTADALYRAFVEGLREHGYTQARTWSSSPAVGEPAPFQLVVNLRTATSLGVKDPQPLLLRADRVIE
jgi:hypothetical protein